MHKGFIDLTDQQFNEIMRLCRFYYREARRCKDTKAFLAGCAMLGAALEAQLIGMVHCFSEEVLRSSALTTRQKPPKELLKWDLSELLVVSKELGWLPGGLSMDEAWNSRRARIGDYAEVLRKIRNLVHPGRYVREHSPKRITAKRLERSFEILDTAVAHLEHKLHDSIGRELQNTQALNAR